MTKLRIAAMTISSLLLTLAICETARAWTANQPLKSFGSGGWRVYNYDFDTDSMPGRAYVDWPVTIIFAGNGTVNEVKSALGDEYDRSGSKMKIWYRLGSAAVDEDGGKKTSKCSGRDGTKEGWLWPQHTNHFRVYAPTPADYFQSRRWGKYSVATTHQDWYECNDKEDRRFGWSERTENDIVGIARSKSGDFGRVIQDRMDLHNPEPDRVEGEYGQHHWRSDRMASWIIVR